MSKREQMDRELFDGIAHKYSKKDLSPYSSVARKLRLLSTLKNIRLPVSSLLEVGCGAGFSANYLKGNYEEYLGLDYSENLIKYAEKYNASPQVKFICADINTFETEKKFDVILMIGVLHHIPEAEKVIGKLSNLLKDEGVIVVNEPQSGNPCIGWLRKIRKNVDSQYSSDQVEFSIEQIEHMFKNCGYSVLSFPQGIFSTPFAESLIFHNFIGVPLIHLFKYLDPIVETVITKLGLRKLAWNVVTEARVLK